MRIYRNMVISCFVVLFLLWVWFVLYPIGKGFSNNVELVNIKLWPSNILTIPCVNGGTIVYPEFIDAESGLAGFKVVGGSVGVRISEYADIEFCMGGELSYVAFVKLDYDVVGGFLVSKEEVDNGVVLVSIHTSTGCDLLKVYGDIVILRCESDIDGIVNAVTIDVSTGRVDDIVKIRDKDSVVGYYKGWVCVYSYEDSVIELRRKGMVCDGVSGVPEYSIFDSVFYQDNIYYVKTNEHELFGIYKYNVSQGEQVIVASLSAKPKMLSINDGDILFSMVDSKTGYDIYSVDYSSGEVSGFYNAPGNQIYPKYSSGYVYWAEKIVTPVSFLSALLFGTEYSQYYIYRKVI